MKAIVPAAGLGTRMLPFSAAAAKELVPLGTRPVIQWTLAEAAAVGVDEAAVVVSPAKKGLRKFLEGELPEAYSRFEAAREWLRLLESVRVRVVEQPEPTGLGDALLRARAALAGESYYLMYPDNVVADGPALFTDLNKTYASLDICIVACKADKPYFRGSNFVIPGWHTDDAFFVESLTRRDDPQPSNIAWRAAGRVIVSDEYFAALEEARPRAEGESRELDDIDAYDALAAAQRLLCLPPSVPIFDAGSPEGYAEAWTAFLDGSLRPPSS